MLTRLQGWFLTAVLVFSVVSIGLAVAGLLGAVWADARELAGR